jgi:hypothetical protein
MLSRPAVWLILRTQRCIIFNDQGMFSLLSCSQFLVRMYILANVYSIPCLTLSTRHFSHFSCNNRINCNSLSRKGNGLLNNKNVMLYSFA